MYEKEVSRTPRIFLIFRTRRTVSSSQKVLYFLSIFFKHFQFSVINAICKDFEIQLPENGEIPRRLRRWVHKTKRVRKQCSKIRFAHHNKIKKIRKMYKKEVSRTPRIVLKVRTRRTVPFSQKVLYYSYVEASSASEPPRART